MSELNETVNVTFQDASVITVPLVENLTATNAAPTAKTVGDALDAKVDAESIMESVRITWNGVQSDNQGVILADADDLPVDENDSVKDVLDAHGDAIDELGEAIEGLSGTVDDAVLVTAQTLTAEQQAQARTNIGAAAADGTVLVTAQTLTDAQKTQVRENIGVAGADGVVLVTAQTLTTAQQEQARANIGAGDNTRVTVVTINGMAGLPYTFNNAGITADMVVVRSVLSNPCAQLCDWTVTATDGSLTIAKAGEYTGIGYGGTDITLYLERTGAETAQTSVLEQGCEPPPAGYYYSRIFTQADEDSIFANNVSSGRITAYRMGRDVNIRLGDFAFSSELTAGQTYIVATLPDNARVFLVQEGYFVSANGQYYGRAAISASNGNITLSPYGTNIPAGTTLRFTLPNYITARDHNDQDLTGYTFVQPS